MSNSPGHGAAVTSRSCKFHMRGAVVVNPSQETADELRQFSSLEYTKNPRVIDTKGMRRQNLSKEYLTLAGPTPHGQGQWSRSRKCYPSVRYISARVYASHGVPVEASTNCCGE